MKDFIKTGVWDSEKVKEILKKELNVTSIAKEDEEELYKLSESITNKDTPSYIASQAKRKSEIYI